MKNPTNRGLPIRVTVADDDLTTRSTVKHLLSGCLAVELAAAYADAQTAIRSLAADWASVLLLDLFMPGLNPLAALAKLRSEKVTSGVATIVIASFPSPNLLHASQWLGAAGWLGKPFTSEILVRAILATQDAALLWPVLPSPPPSAGRFESPAGNEVWIGEPFDSYVIVGQKIWGVTQSGETLKIRPSQSATDAANGQDVSVTEFLTKFVANPGSMFWTDGSVSTLPLHLVFGCVPLYTQNPASHVDQSLQLTNVTVVSDQVTAGFRGLVSGLDLSLTVNSKQEIVKAFRGGDRLPILCRRFQPPGEIEAWFGLGVRNWPSPQGGQATLGSIRENANTDKTGQSIGVAYANLAVLIATGDLWIGPDMCDRMVIDGRMIGMRIDGSTREVQIFNTTRARLPLTGDTSEAFLQGIRQFEAEFAANQYRWRPDVSISIPALFAGDSRFSENCEFYKRQISLRDKNIVVGLCSGNSQALPEIVLGPDLKVLSTRVLSVDAPELRIPSHPIDPKHFRVDED